MDYLIVIAVIAFAVWAVVLAGGAALGVVLFFNTLRDGERVEAGVVALFTAVCSFTIWWLATGLIPFLLERVRPEAFETTVGWILAIALMLGLSSSKS